MRYFEDIEVGAARASSESYRVSAEEIKAFAQQFDPMPFHLDEAAAAASPMGALCASSIHTVAIGAKLSHSLSDSVDMAVLGGLGWEEVRFPLPLFAGDEVTVRTRIVHKRRSKTRPDRGIITSQIEIVKRDGSVAAHYKNVTLVACRPEPRDRSEAGGRD